MSQKGVVAFGGYLKLLRERRQMSLYDVVTLTKAYPEPLNKGYLSRVERGLSHVSFSKAVALARAYEVPIDALGEKWSLDIEVDHLKGLPQVKGRPFQDLVETAYQFTKRGARLEAYSIYRHLVVVAAHEDVAPRYVDRAQQVAVSTANHGVAAARLGRFGLAEIEILHAKSLGALGKDDLPMASITLHDIARHYDRLDEAEQHIDQAIAESEAAPSHRLLAHSLFCRGSLADAKRDYYAAIGAYKRAYSVFRDRGDSPDAARTMLNLGVSYLHARRIGAARRSVDVAYRLARSVDAVGVCARATILIGDIELAEGREKRAISRWMDALRLARGCHDRTAAFYAELHLFKHALSVGNVVAAQAYGRRLNRLWPWLPASEEGVRSFRELWATHRPTRQRRVADRQHVRQR